MVGATSVRLTKPSRCVVVDRSSPGAKPGPRTDGDGQGVAALGGVGPTHHHLVVRSTCSSSRPTMRSVVSQRVGADP